MYRIGLNLFFVSLLLMIGSTLAGIKCPVGSLDCGNGNCVALNWLCDGVNDCGNFKDEENCINGVRSGIHCSSNQFQCVSDKVCIPKEQRCDDEFDCKDGSDEQECGNAREKCLDGFVCRNHQCIHKALHCDGKVDCTDRSDEEFCSPGDPCSNAACSQNCKNTREGARCYCNEGYSLEKDNKTCLRDTLKKRWQYLKDEYRRINRRSVSQNAMQACRDFLPFWKQFGSLMKEDPIIDKQSNNLDNDLLHSSESKSFPNLEIGISHPESFSAMVELEKKKINLMEKFLNATEANEKLQKDGDYMFVMSILPYMKRLSHRQNFKLRKNIENWFMKEMYES